MESLRLAVAVFCGSQTGLHPVYGQTAYALGQALAQRSIGLIYGGASIGLMGRVADGCLSAGGHVVGVLPNALLPYEIVHRGIASLAITETMHERKALMYQRADAFIILPGGVGTLEELFEVVTWAHIGIHAKPIALLNVAGFFDPLLAYLHHAGAAGFITPAFHTFAQVYTEEGIPRMLAELQRCHAPAVPYTEVSQPEVRGTTVAEENNCASTSILDNIPADLSDLATAQQLTMHAARVGFNWRNLGQIWEKIQEELAELEAELRSGDRNSIAAELGDVLFAVANLARWLGLDAEGALRATNSKFRSRFNTIERGARALGRSVPELGFEEMEALWAQAKRQAYA
jgi:uncharacterized protein (TIGR00730 family)